VYKNTAAGWPSLEELNSDCQRYKGHLHLKRW
jgi:hypothetical protein